MSKFFYKKPKILSSDVVVRPQWSWQRRLLFFMISVALLLALSWGMYEAGKSATTGNQSVIPEKFDFTYDPGVCQQTKKQKLCSHIGDLTHQLQMNSTTSDNLSLQVKSLTYENDQLKEKLVFFQHLMSGNSKNGISIHQFNLKATDTPGKYRYTLTLIQGGGKPTDFKGKLRLQVKLQQNNQSKTIPLTTKDGSTDFPVHFRFLHRLDESFQVPADTTVENLLVQILENGNDKALLTQTAQPAL